MTLIRLHNDDWGLETNCFACEPRNERGLQIGFFHDTEREVVVAEFELGDDFSGGPTLVHGGVVLTVLDEAMAWACIAVGGQWAVTQETTSRFHRPVRVGKRYTVEAAVVAAPDDRDDPADVMRTTGVITDRHGTARVEAQCELRRPSARRRCSGSPAKRLPDEHRSYLRDA